MMSQLDASGLLIKVGHAGRSAWTWPPRDEPQAREFASFPTGFKSRGAKLKTETKIVEGPARPVYGAPNRPEQPAPWQPAEKKEKRQSIYAPGSSLANPSKKKRKRMGAPHGPQF